MDGDDMNEDSPEATDRMSEDDATWDSQNITNDASMTQETNFVSWAKASIGKIDVAILHNSTSSIKADSHIGKPDFTKIILCVSMVIHCQVLEGTEANLKSSQIHHFFDECFVKEMVDHDDSHKELTAQSSSCDDDIDRRKISSNQDIELETPDGSLCMEHSTSEDFKSTNSIYFGSEPRGKRTKVDYPLIPAPSVEDVIRLISSLCKDNAISAECGIVALIYLNRLMGMTGIKIDSGNYRPLICTTLFVAQKVWQDRYQRSSAFSKTTGFSRKALRFLESKFVDLIEFDTFITRSTYSKYYYDLRALAFEKCDIQLQEMSPMDAYRLEVRSKRFGIPQKNKSLKTARSKCLEDVEFVKPKSWYVIS